MKSGNLPLELGQLLEIPLQISESEEYFYQHFPS